MSRNLAVAFLALLFLLTLSGCGTMSPEPEPLPKSASMPAPVAAAAPTPEPVPKSASIAAAAPTRTPLYHVWSYLRVYGDEPKGYATYSYVLAGRDQSDASHIQRYNALIAAIRGSTPSASDFPQSVQRSLMNLFLIPGGGSPDALNVGLSMSLVSALTVSDARFNNPGPFIVTLYHPINFSSDPELTILFVDLTNTHPDAMSEIATVYKQRISQAPLQGVERLHSLKLALLNAALVAEDRIGFATTAYADLRKALISE